MNEHKPKSRLELAIEAAQADPGKESERQTCPESYKRNMVHIFENRDEDGESVQYRVGIPYDKYQANPRVRVAFEKLVEAVNEDTNLRGDGIQLLYAFYLGDLATTPLEVLAA